MKKIILVLLVALFASFAFGGEPKVRLGIDVLRSRNFDILRGKRVGLVTNPTGMTADLQATIDVLFNAQEVKLVALFGPEHGVRGDFEAGGYIPSYVDQKTNLPVYSLYGKTRKPTAEMLKGIEMIVYDIQDVGARSYTYISTLGLVMEAAAENGVTVVVLDRPNPLSGLRAEGPMLEPRYKSFVGAYPIPYVYGMTVGELAQMVNSEQWLTNGVRCPLIVVPMEGWQRSMWWDDTGLEWVPTSPHIPHANTVLFYVLTGLLGELGTVNQGVGYTLPFELVGAPWLDGAAYARFVNSRGLEGAYLRPLFYKPFYMDTTGVRYGGVQIHVTDRERLNITELQMTILWSLVRMFPNWNIFDRARPEKIEMFDKVCGTMEVRRQLTNGSSPQDLLRYFQQMNAPFLEKRKKYLMYQ